MANYTWQFDVNSGVFKNNFISNKVRYAAIIEAVFQQFVKVEPGYGKGKGDTVNIRRLKNVAVPTSAVLNENTKIPVDTFATSNTAITITEWGRGVEFTSFAKDLETFDLENGVQRKLKDQMQVVIDNAAAAAFKASTVFVCAIPTSLTDITWDVDGTPSTPATANLTSDHLGVIRDYFKGFLSALCSPLFPSCLYA